MTFRSPVFRILGAVLTSAALALPATAQFGTPLNWGFPIVAQNRGVLHDLGGGEDLGAFSSHGIYTIDDYDVRISIRFTMPTSKTLEAVWLYSEAFGATVGFELSVHPTDSIQQPDLNTTLGSSSYNPTSGWQSIGLGAGISLVQGQTYHLVIQADSGLDGTSGANYYATVSRFEVPFHDVDPSNEHLSFFDPEVVLMLDDGTPAGFVSQWHPADTFDGINPLHVLEFSDDTYLGWPYDVHLVETVDADDWYGQAIDLESGTITFDYVAMLLRKSVAGSAGRLILEILEAGVQTPLDRVVLIDPAQNPVLYLGRSHWFGVRLDEPITFDATGGAKTYYLRLKGEAGGVGYAFSLETSSLGLGDDELPTYRNDRSYAVHWDGSTGQLTAVEGGDTGFILAMLEDDHPIGIYDEGHVEYTTSGGTEDDVRVVDKNETLTIAGTFRNIGPVDGDIWVDLIDVDTGSSVLTKAIKIEGVGSNEELTLAVSAAGNFSSGNDPVLRLAVLTGHFDGSTRVTDDVHRLEIRTLP